VYGCDVRTVLYAVTATCVQAHRYNYKIEFLQKPS
jgi:hypothetical protein